MAVGDKDDFIARLKSLLPPQWFEDGAPVLTGMLSGVASVLASLYALNSWAQAHARISTATDLLLDLISRDYFGTWMPRRIGEGDGPFLNRIKKELLRPRGTRAALVQAVTDLTGSTPTVFEPANPSDTGGYSVGGVGYGLAGGWGSLSMPYQFFITLAPPKWGGISSVDGYGGSIGGYGVGSIEYASLDYVTGEVSYAEIYARIAAVLPACATAWVLINSAPTNAALDEFVLDMNSLG